jgi:hypothetical protein
MKRSAIKKVLAGLSSACMIATAIPFTAAQAAEKAPAYGDANCDGEVNMSDAVMIMQACLNPSKYDVTGTDNDRITVEGKLNGDVDGKDGINLTDALLIQQYSLKLIDKLPIEENVDPVTDNVKIILSGSSITVEGDTNGYTAVEGTTLTISHSGSYYIEGTLDDGQICVNIPDEAADPDTVKLFLNGASITGKSAPAILVSNSENTSVNIVDGTENTLSDGDTAYVDAAGTPTNDAVIEAKDDITIKGGELGTGVLSITANTQKAVSCNNDIKINGGVVNIKTLNSTDKTDAVAAKKSVTVKSGTLTIDAEGDGIKSSKDAVSITGGTVSIKAGNDAVQAETSIDISGGEIIAGGDRGFTAASVNITGGTVIATATDNQAKNVTAENQAVFLLNCIDDETNTKDGTWKKANTLIVSSMSGKVDFTKKYKYVLISDPSMLIGKQVFIENLGNNATAAYGTGEDKNDRFDITDSVNTFDNVDLAAFFPVPETVDPAADGDNTINFNGGSVETSAASDSVTVNEGAVTITKPGKYTVTGSSATAQITVDVDKTAYPEGKVELVLNDVQLANLNTAPIYVASIGDEMQITAKAGTYNTISDGTSHTQTYTDSDGNVNTVEGAVFARDDIKFKGSGILEISGNTDDAIVCKNDIKIYNGNITVTAVDDGIRAKDSVTIGDDVKSDGTAADNSGLKLTVKTSQGDGIKATSTDTSADKSYGAVTVNGGTIDINSYGDGIQAEQEFIMNGGDLNIYTCTGSTYTASGSSSGSQDGNSNKTDVSAKGIKAVGLYDAAGTTWQSKGNITINGGNITVDSSDDCIHCSGDAVLNAGKLKLASADDAVHSDASLYIGGKTAGTDYTSLEVYVTACYEGMEAVYIYQNNGNIYIVSRDDGYNSAGGADSSGNNNNTGFGQGGWGFPGGGGMSSTYGEMYLNGGIVSVNTSFNDADGFDSNGPVIFNGGYYFGNGGDSFDSGDGYSITYNGGYALGGLGMNGGKGYDMSTQMVFAASDGTVLASSKTGSRLTYAYGDSNVTAYSNAEVTGGTNISTLGQPALYVSGKVSGGTAMTRGQGSSTQPGRPGYGG